MSETTLTVRYAETDAQGIVHHSNYLVWFEEGRSDYLRQKGLNYSDFERQGYFVVVAGADVKYKAPAFYEDRITVRTSLERIQGKVIEFTYEALNAEERLIAQGRTVHVVLGEDRRPVDLPREIADKLQEPTSHEDDRKR